MKTPYEKRVEEMAKRKCPNCQGTGKLDNADIDDISFNEWKCEPCEGTGFIFGIEFTLEEDLR